MNIRAAFHDHPTTPTSAGARRDRMALDWAPYILILRRNPRAPASAVRSAYGNLREPQLFGPREAGMLGRLVVPVLLPHYD